MNAINNDKIALSTPVEQPPGLGLSKVSDRRPKVSKVSRFLEPIDITPGRLSGRSRTGGDISPGDKMKVIELIIKIAHSLPTQDQLSLLTIASIESGFNPDAASTSSSAAGIFQIINDTAARLGLAKRNVFDAEQNIRAGIELLRSNRELNRSLFIGRSAIERTILDYALHHDGPALNSGGLEIARKRVPKTYQEMKAILGNCS